jgi:hypothetical protein
VEVFVSPYQSARLSQRFWLALNAKSFRLNEPVVPPGLINDGNVAPMSLNDPKRTKSHTGETYHLAERPTRPAAVTHLASNHS